jgi:GH18 family chitinase
MESVTQFIAMVRGALAHYDYTSSLSVAMPASFWYLKGFDVKGMVGNLDSVMFMTYDLHGQWDYSNQWSSPGCPAGNCLRSHINMTETINALSMGTKAGIPASKIIVGITSYSRSFKMAQAGCTGVMCKFTGPASGAKAGRCTGTQGYLADGEIRDIRARGGNV